MEFLRQFLNQAKQVFSKLDAKQKGVVLIVSVLSVVVIVYLMSWTGERQWTVLQSNLQPEDVQKIIEFLDGEGVPYQLETDGTAIKVPQGTELDLRLKVTSEGLITGGTIGYEIFDRPNLGMTDFLQQVQYKRALEGELSRTIRFYEMIEFAQVHIVVPKPALFVQDEKPTTASVFLRIKPGEDLSAEQIKTIAALVASSVEGLKSSNVSISDSYGVDLSKVISKDPSIALRSDQLRIQSSKELDMRTKLETILAEAVGPNNYIVNVSVEMDFMQTSIESKSYDPNSQVVLSEERRSSSGGLRDTLGQSSVDELTTTNYVIDETVTRSVDEFGKIERVTVSVLVNGTYDDQGNYTPRGPTELTALEESVRNAIGIDLIRGDLVSVRDYQFDITALQEQESRQRAQEREAMFWTVVRWLGMFVAAVGFIFVLRSVFRSLDLLLPKPKPKPAIDIEAEAIEEEISAEAQRRAQMLDQVSRFTKEKPSNVASLMNTWLIEEK